MNNLLSNCGLVQGRISASEKDLPVQLKFYFKAYVLINKNFGLASTFHIDCDERWASSQNFFTLAQISQKNVPSHYPSKEVQDSALGQFLGDLSQS